MYSAATLFIHDPFSLSPDEQLLYALKGSQIELSRTDKAQLLDTIITMLDAANYSQILNIIRVIEHLGEDSSFKDHCATILCHIYTKPNTFNPIKSLILKSKLISKLHYISLDHLIKLTPTWFPKHLLGTPLLSSLFFIKKAGQLYVALRPTSRHLLKGYVIAFCIAKGGDAFKFAIFNENTKEEVETFTCLSGNTSTNMVPHSWRNTSDKQGDFRDYGRMLRAAKDGIASLFD